MSIDSSHFSSAKVPLLEQAGGNNLVPPAMLIAAIALGLAGHLHIGLSAEMAVALGVALFCIMLMCHILLRAADAAERAEDEAAERHMELVDSPMPRTMNAEPYAGTERTMTAPPAPPAVAPMTAPVNSPVFDAPPMHAQQPDPVYAPVSTLRAATVGQQEPSWHFAPTDLQPPATASGASFPPAAPVFQPIEDIGRSAAAFGQLRPSHGEHAIRPTAPAVPDTPVNREAERIDAILKRLASQIQSGAARRQSDADPIAQEPIPQVPVAPGTVAGAAPAAAETASPNPETTLSTAVDALRTTVEAMRIAMDAKPTQQAPATPVELRVAAVAEALRAERADVFLAPILGLSDQQARHFEVSVKLRSEAGELLDGRDEAAGAGLLPLLDALNVRHAAGFALKLERRGREGAVFSQVAGGSLESEQFVHDVAGRHSQGIADRLVLAFEQNQMRWLGPAQLAALGDLGRLGFRCALQGIGDLDMDFEALRALGFEFVKLDAAVFLGGLQCNGAHVPPTDICRYFEDLGLTVIVSGIQDAATRDQMLGCGVAYGQGPLFGEPKPVPFIGLPGGVMAA